MNASLQSRGEGERLCVRVETRVSSLFIYFFFSNDLAFRKLFESVMMMMMMMMMRYLEIALGGEGLLADGALEGFVAGVRSHVDLERRGRGEILIANLAQVLAGHACKYTHTRNSLSCPQK